MEKIPGKDDYVIPKVGEWAGQVLKVKEYTFEGSKHWYFCSGPNEDMGMDIIHELDELVKISKTYYRFVCWIKKTFGAANA